MNDLIADKLNKIVNLQDIIKNVIYALNQKVEEFKN